MEICAKCKQPVICGHSISLDALRRTWRLCCLCAAELIAQFDREQEDAR